MLEQIETALNAKDFVTDVKIVDIDGFPATNKSNYHSVEYRLNGVWYFAKLVRGKFKADKARRSLV